MESCKDNADTNKFDNMPINSHQQCKNGCGDKFYYDNEKICREESCNLFKVSIRKECVTQCGPN